MTPKLIAISGPAHGKTFLLTRADTTLGREPGNHICIADIRLSRQHCHIEQRAGGYLLRDAQSLNGSFVNDLPVQERPLQHRDRIRLGGSELVFLCREEDEGGNETGQPLPPRVADEGEQAPTLTVSAHDSLYLGAVGLTPAASPRTLQNYRALLRLHQALNAQRGWHQLQASLFALIGETLPITRGALLLFETAAGSGEFASVYGWSRNGEAEQTASFSRSLVAHVMRDGVAVLCDDLTCTSTKDAAFAPSESLVHSGATSVLAAPLIAFGRTIGALYLTVETLGGQLDQEDLELVVAIAGLAAGALDHAWRFAQLEEDRARLRAAVAADATMIGESAPLQKVRAFVTRAAQGQSAVLICGESGTGKELVARALHNQSERCAGPFIAVNCATLLKELMRSELFGHEKGAFSGATERKLGKFELANGGTFFLDEIGELEPDLQAQLLRVIQEGECERLGGRQTIKLDLRLIAATNRDLEAEVAAGRFRQDLYYRLNVLRLQMPPLRARREDVPLLAQYFIAKYSQKCKRRVEGLTPQARARLLAHDWPGNVRELENAILHAVDIGTTELIELEDLPERLLTLAPESTVTPPVAVPNPSGALGQATGGAHGYHAAVREAKRAIIQQAFAQAGGSHMGAAKLLGVHRNNLHRMLRELQLDAQGRPQ